MNDINLVEDLRKDIVFKINELKRRGALCSELNISFTNTGFSNFNTFKSLVSKINKLESGDVKKQLNDAQKVVDKVLSDHIKFNNKRAYFYSVPAKYLTNIFTFLQSQNEFFLLGESSNHLNYELLDHKNIETCFTLDDNDFKVIYLKSIRNRKDNIRIPNEIHLIESLEDEKIIDLIKVVQYEMNAFDFIAFDFKNESLILGADLNQIFSRQESEKAIDKIQISLRKLAKLPDLSKINLRNCVENFEKEEVGDVLDHAFITAEGGYNHAGKTITNGQDVRKDNFHADGIKGKEADYYGIAKSYQLQNSEKVVIRIRMTFRDYKKSNVPIRFAVLDGIKSFEGLKFSIRKVLQHNHN